MPERTRHTNQLATHIVDVASGEIADSEPTPEEQGQDPSAVALGKTAGTLHLAAIAHDPSLPSAPDGACDG
jgi:hypothetical protein